MIERLRRQWLWLRDRPARAGRLRFGDVEPVGILHERVKAAAAGPRACVAIGGERDANDAGLEPRRFLGAEAVLGNGARPIALDENVGLAQQGCELRAPARLA